MEQKEVLGSGNSKGTTNILVANSKGEEIFKIKDDIITINLNNMESKKVTLNNGTVWLPYTEPTPQKEWKTFMIEIDWNGYTSREIVQCESLEIAKQHYNNAISIQEVKLNIEPVNS